MKGRILSVLLNPFVLALLMWVPIVYFFPINFDKYQLQLVEEKVHSNISSRYYYEDLDNDGAVEEIRAQYNDIGNSAISVRLSNNAVLDQWNLQGNFVYRSETSSVDKKIDFLDINNDGVKEIYTLTRKDSLILMNCIMPFDNKSVEYSKPIISNYHTAYQYDLMYGNLLKTDLNKDNKHEILFSLKAGYGVHPRKVFVYDPNNDSIWSSPFLCNKSEINEIRDINGDQYPELVLKSSGAGNNIDSSKYHCSDYEVRQWVLDSNLKPIFKPIVFKKPFAGIHTFSFQDKDSSFLISYFHTSGATENGDRLLQLNLQGKIIKTKNIPGGNYNFFKTGDNKFLLINTNTGQCLEVTKNLNVSQAGTVSPYTHIKQMNVDQDEELEFIILSTDFKKISIAQEDGSHLTSHPIPDSDDRRYIFGSFVENDQPKIFIQRGYHLNFFTLQQNPWYGMQYPLYAGIYGGLLGLIFLVIKGQKIREQKRQAIASEISELQVKAIKNQVDPHFVFNSINAISSMVQGDDKHSADRFIVRFSNLMRQTLTDSDKIATTLQKEVDYVENYIQLQQTRFNNSFDYVINTTPEVDLNRTVPKHVLYTYVENSIKHGLANREDGQGQLTINIFKANNQLQLNIEDNGTAKKGAGSQTTGRGMQIMEEIYNLYQQIYNTRIYHEASYQYDNTGEVTGHVVTVKFK